MDVWPTVFDLVGMDPLEDVDGVSRVPEILAAASGEPLSDSGELGVAELDETWGRQTEGPRLRIAVTEGPYRYVLRNPPAERPKAKAKRP